MFHNREIMYIECLGNLKQQFRLFTPKLTRYCLSGEIGCSAVSGQLITLHLQYITVHYSTLQYITVLFITVHYITVQYITVSLADELRKSELSLNTEISLKVIRIHSKGSDL